MSGMIIIGAGLAGLTVAETLRAEGYEGSITLIGDEAHAPYQRPPLSKGFLLGETVEAQLMMRPAEVLAKKNIALKVGAGVTAIDRAAKQVTLTDGSTLAYDGLALCTGSRLRPLPLAGADWQGVYGLRSLDDAKAIVAALETAQNVVIIGGGFIGLEVAAVARRKDKKVTVLEAADRLMPRVVPPLISQFYLDLHTRHGAEVVLGALVSELVGQDGRITAVRTNDGREFPADLVLVGIGIIANAELARAAGLEVDGGIVVDACGRTSDPAIVAAGDCTVRRLEDGSLCRLESVQNALEQGKSAATALLGRERPFTAAPWFWSDQYDVKLQMLGLTAGFDRMVTRGDATTQKFSAYYYRAGRLIAIDSLNQPADHMNGRKLFDKGIAPTPEQAADPAFDLGSLLV
ncbi:MAG: ferredoxin--NAD+ reductase [Rhodocyclaceae bacterium]|nr:MAG: ferredoxin--NAD+ reductase [Rhodocyclaceae bacterium]TNC99878.1 MAG: ferredoxin--NAD+ reductase [Rhodocyclaceae bacterium]